jgi:pentapeptide MXKDX repeat protein
MQRRVLSRFQFRIVSRPTALIMTSDLVCQPLQRLARRAMDAAHLALSESWRLTDLPNDHIGTAHLHSCWPLQTKRGLHMKKIIIVTAALGLMCSSAFAQNQTGPAAQSNNMQKPGMEKGSMDRGAMDRGTTGMSNGSMSRDGTSNGGMVQPDASGQGGSGPGSDQGGTRTKTR